MNVAHVGMGILTVALSFAAMARQQDMPVPYAPLEPSELYVPNALDETNRPWVRYSYRAALHGDLTSAIELMQLAANALVRRHNDDFELWDNLAELYCAGANRERDAARAARLRANGLAMIAEFRCAAKVFSGSEYDMACHIGGDLVPNPVYTPLCFQVFCTPGERDAGDVPSQGGEDEVDERPDIYALYLAKFRQDAANLPVIEKLCRGSRVR